MTQPPSNPYSYCNATGRSQCRSTAECKQANDAQCRRLTRDACDASKTCAFDGSECKPRPEYQDQTSCKCSDAAGNPREDAACAVSTNAACYLGDFPSVVSPKKPGGDPLYICG